MCFQIHDMRHVREHFSIELMLDEACLSTFVSKEAQQYAHGIAAMSSNHTAATATAIYAGVFEKNRCHLVHVLCAMSAMSKFRWIDSQCDIFCIQMLVYFGDMSVFSLRGTHCKNKMCAHSLSVMSENIELG
jgi:hypothetical protein